MPSPLLPMALALLLPLSVKARPNLSRQLVPPLGLLPLCLLTSPRRLAMPRCPCPLTDAVVAKTVSVLCTFLLAAYP